MARNRNTDLHDFPVPRADELMTAAALGTLFVKASEINSSTGNR